MSATISDLYKSIVLEMSVVFPGVEARAIADRLFEYYFDLLPMQRVLEASELAPDENSGQLKIAVSKVLKRIGFNSPSGNGRNGEPDNKNFSFK